MNNSPLQTSFSLDDINAAANQFWQYAHSFRILCFAGEMGAGKTTFIKSLCHLLQMQDNVSSPTFSLMNEYRFKEAGKTKVCYHMDWYRLKNMQEAVYAGMEDALLQPDALCLIEWPQIAEALLPKPYILATLQTVSEKERTLTARIIS